MFNFIYSIKEDFKISINDIFAGFYIRIFLFAGVVLNSLIWLLAKKIKTRAGGEQIVLHYNVDTGIDFYGDPGKIYTLPILGFIVFFVNFVIFIIINKNKDKKFISNILFVSSVLVNIILLVAISSLYLVNYG